MRVLVACEFSGIVRDAFIAKGHDAISCDLLPTERPGPHIQGDVRKVLSEAWDLVIAFPPCTHLSNAGARYWKEKIADGRQQQAIDFAMNLAAAGFRSCVENPVGRLSTSWRKPDQIIQPYEFGHSERKTTCLWLKGLSQLHPASIVDCEPRGFCIRKSGKDAGKKYNYYFQQGKTAKERSRTFSGIAQAMAEQWGSTELKSRDINGQK